VPNAPSIAQISTKSVSTPRLDRKPTAPQARSHSRRRSSAFEQGQPSSHPSVTASTNNEAVRVQDVWFPIPQRKGLLYRHAKVFVVSSFCLRHVHFHRLRQRLAFHRYHHPASASAPSTFTVAASCCSRLSHRPGPKQYRIFLRPAYGKREGQLHVGSYDPTLCPGD
jgi:hypothetical protein